MHTAMNSLRAVCFALLLSGCASTMATTPSISSATERSLIDARETHLSDLKQLTFEGENAEAYFSFDGNKLSLQRRGPNEPCDRIFTLDTRQATPQLSQVSSGQGATTCAHYLPDNDTLVYASTHLSGAACPPKPDMSLGYVWALYDSFDIFRVKENGAELTRLTETKGYDAEATVCSVDGSIVFTSTRDGDIELYRMDKDGANVKRLTHSIGYDGGAFFNKDCTQLVWRASRPRPGKELNDYQALLQRGLVRPSKLELYVGNADGTEAKQITALNAASFAPFFLPDGKRVIFSSNAGDPKGREFNLWAVNTDGTQLEQITFANGFDGFPMFSPDGKYLAFSSNRATAPGKTDTNLFIARWNALPVSSTPAAADRLKADVAWLSDNAREGRGLGSNGLRASGEFIEAQMKALDLSPMGEDGFRSKVDIVTSQSASSSTSLRINSASVSREDYTPLSFSAAGTVNAPLVFVEYGLEDASLGLDDYAKKSVAGKIVLVRRFVPDNVTQATPNAERALGDLRKKAFYAKSHGAVALLVVDLPRVAAGAEFPAEAPFPSLQPDNGADVGIPVLMVRRDIVKPWLAALQARKKVDAAITVAFTKEASATFNVVGLLKAPSASAGTVVIGAHYDHLGMGGPGSLAPGISAVHPGADDNASGTATLLEIARQLKRRQGELQHDIVFIAFTGEESGLLGSGALVRSGPPWLKQTKAMLNLDMVGRLRNNTLSVLGTDTASQWKPVVEKACEGAKVNCTIGGDGYGPSDHMSFFTAGIPVLHFFTGAHADYHKPTDLAERFNAAGAAQIASLVADIAVQLNGQNMTLSKRTETAPSQGDMRSFGASLGTVPDYAASANVKGVVLADVRPGGAAEKAGMRKGDVLIKLGTFEIRSVEDLMFVLQKSKPRDTVKAIVLRDSKPLECEATFQESRRR
jgi:Tol biopolymer transport system component